MKKFILITIFGLLVVIASYGQTSTEQWGELIKTTQKGIDAILIKECPADVDIYTYKLRLYKGEAPLSEEAKSKLAAFNSKLVKYGQEVAGIRDLIYEEESDLIVYAMFSPDARIESGYFTTEETIARQRGLSWSEVLHCAGIAIGADAVAMLSQSGASSWSISTIKKVFKGVAKRILGPIGVAIATITFAGCLINEGFD